MRRNHGDAIDLLLMRLDESGVFFKGGQVFPALQIRGVDQEPELACLPNDGFKRIAGLWMLAAERSGRRVEVTYEA